MLDGAPHLDCLTCGGSGRVLAQGPAAGWYSDDAHEVNCDDCRGSGHRRCDGHISDPVGRREQCGDEAVRVLHDEFDPPEGAAFCARCLKIALRWRDDEDPPAFEVAS